LPASTRPVSVATGRDVAVLVGEGLDIGVGVRVSVGRGVNVGNGVNVGRGVGVRVNVGKGVNVGKDVNVGSGVSMGRGVDVRVNVGRGVKADVGVKVEVATGNNVGVLVEVDTGFTVGVNVRTGVGVAVETLPRMVRLLGTDKIVVSTFAPVETRAVQSIGVWPACWLLMSKVKAVPPAVALWPLLPAIATMTIPPNGPLIATTGSAPKRLVGTILFAQPRVAL
jgi:hypothetical protein